MYKIAITIRQTEDSHLFFMKESYYNFLKDDFQIELVLPRENHNYQDIVKRNDALLICGGDDIKPSYYCEIKKDKTVVENQNIEMMDFDLLAQFYKAKKVIIGICRGIQVIHVFFHGTLYQDINNQYQTSINHLKDKHTIYTYGSLYHYFPSVLQVNSYHHQNIHHISPMFRINAVSEDNLIEGIENNYVLAVQWHPELMDKEHQKYFILLINEKIEKNINLL